MHTPKKPIPCKTNQTQNTPNTAHCRRSLKQTAQRAEKVVERTMLNKNGTGALNAMSSTRRKTKDNGKSSERSATKRNREGRNSSEKRPTQRKRDRREVERAVRDGMETGRAGSRAKNAQRNETGRWGKNRREMRFGKNYVSKPQQKLAPTT